MSNNYEDPYSNLRTSKQQSKSALDQLKKPEKDGNKLTDKKAMEQQASHCLTLPTNQSSKVTSSINFKESIK